MCGSIPGDLDLLFGGSTHMSLLLNDGDLDGTLDPGEELIITLICQVGGDWGRDLCATPPPRAGASPIASNIIS